MYAFRSVILTAIFLLVSTRVDIAIASLHECNFPAGFHVATENAGKAYFYQSEIIVNVPDDGYSIFKYPEATGLTFTVSNVDLNFNGNVVYAKPEVNSMQPFQVCHSLKGRISGVAQRIEYLRPGDHDKPYLIADCHVFILPVYRETNGILLNGLNVSSKIANEIYRLAESCIESAICSQVGELQNEYKMGSPDMSGFAQMPLLTNYMYEDKGLSWTKYSYWKPFPLVVSRIMENDTKILTESLKRTGNTRFIVPNIDLRFMTIRNSIATKGHFEATNGIFINGMENILHDFHTRLSHEGLKFIIESRYSINGLNIHYNYKLKHGNAMSKGRMHTYMGYVKFNARLIIDYNEIPCRTYLGDIKVMLSDKIYNTFTDAGSLQSLLDTKNWFDKKASDDLAERIELLLRDGINSLNPGLETFNCEKYRL